MTPTVILVDDDLNVCQSIKRSLKNEPYRVITVDSAQSCIDLLAVIDAQIIISDLAMPGYNGAELVACLKEMRPEIIRIVLSGTLNRENILDLINRGQVFRCLEKPCTGQQLSFHIREALQLSSATASNILPMTKSVINESERHDMTSLIHEAIKDVERLDRALSERCERGSPNFKKYQYG